MKSRTFFALLSSFVLFAIATPSTLARSTYQVRPIEDEDIINLLGDGISHSPEYSVSLNTIGGGDSGDGIRWFFGFDANTTTSDGNPFSIFPEGIVLSTGKCEDGVGSTNENRTTPSFASQNGTRDVDLSAYYGRDLDDVSGILLYVIPSNHTINIPLVVASTEYFHYSQTHAPSSLPPQFWTREKASYDSYNDCFAFFVAAGHTNRFTRNIAKLAGDIDLSIGAVNPYTNQTYFVANVDMATTNANGTIRLQFPSDKIPIPFQYNGLITGPCAVMTNAIPGQEYTLKIIVGDGGDLLYDTAVFLKAKGITSGADLKLTVTADPDFFDEIAGGVTSTVTFVVENIGPAPAWGVELTNSVPVCDDGAWTWSEPEVWQLPDLPSGASFTTNLVVTFGDAAVNYSELTVSGIVVTATGDYDMSNNADSATIKWGVIPLGSISGFVWDDANQDGIFSDSETNLNGVAVSLYTNAVAGTAFATTTTTDDGYYFDRLPLGEYIVVFDAPDGYSGFSTKHAIDDPGVNSDAEAGEPLLRSQTDVLEIAQDGETVDYVNAAVYRALTVIPASKIWDDANDQDGIRPDSVTLSLCTNGVVIATADATNGDWSVYWEDFPKYVGTNVIEYFVREDDVPAGYNVDTAYNGQMWEVVNHHTPSNVTVSVTKIWDDDANRDGIRPREVSFTLFGITDGGASTNLVATTNIFASAYAADANKWPFAWENLPMCAGGEVIVYDVQEEPLSTPDHPSLYIPSVDPDGPYDFTFTNTHIPSNVTVTVSKVWDDADNQDGIRPVEVTFSLLSNNVSFATAAVSADNGWTNAWTGLFERSAGTLIEWSVEESSVPNGYTPSSLNSGNDWTFTNTHVPSNVTVTVSKEWNDVDNQDGIRPTEVTFSLLSNNVSVATVMVSADNGWTNAWADLPQCDSGSPIAYGVREDPVPEGYTPSVVTNGLYDFTITNTHTTDVVTVTATKRWEDGDNADRRRPTTVTLTLTSNAVAVATAEVSEQCSWSVSWEGLAKNSAGTPIPYGVIEADADVPEGYSASVVTNGVYDFTVVNTHELDPIDVTATKVWDDDDDRECLRPDEVTLSLYAGGVWASDAVVSEATGWTTTWSNLVQRSAGTNIVYTVQEDTVPEYYTNSWGNVDNVWSITNTHEIERVTITATKVWDDTGNQDNIRPNTVTLTLYADGEEIDSFDATGDSLSKTWEDLPKFIRLNDVSTNIVYDVREAVVPDDYTASCTTNVLPNGFAFTITNTHTTDVVTVTATKRWDDADNQDGIRPDEVTFSLLSNNVAVATAELSADNGWTNVWTGLAERSAGTPIQWSVEESPVPEGYYDSVASAGNSWRITNTHVPSNVTVTATKVWDDADNQDGIRPGAVTLSLLSNGVSVATSNVSADLGWQAAWTDLPAYAAGQLIAWTVAEDTDLSPEYTATASNRDYDWTITNTHVPSNVTVTATKEWDDADNQDGIRPASVTFSLLSNNVAVATAELSADTGWTNVWTGLSERSAGTPIQWSVEESPVPEGYYDSVASAGNTWRITNTHVPSNVTVTATKSWNDDDDRDRLRPASVTFSLLSNNVAVATAELSADNGWTNVWTGLSERSAGTPIQWSVEESPVPEGYTPSVVTNGLYDFTVVNTHAPSNVTITVTKVWSDADNQDGRRPASATLSLYADGVKVRDFTASGSNLTKTWNDLPANAAGTPIDYTVQEDSVPTGYYVLSIVKTATENGFSFVVTNRHPPVKVDISVVKVWDDGNDADKLRPSSVSVSLKANGTVVKTATLSAGGGWATTWTGLPKYANGSAIQYTLVENNIPSGYSCGSIPRVSSSTGYSFTVTNTHSTGTPSLKTTATWTLNRSDGLIYGTFTLKNTGKKAFASNTDFWLATPGSGKTWYIYNPTGQMPDGAAYYDFSAAVRAAAKKVGNKNAVLDPGESVSVTGVKIYHKSRISPAEYLDVKTATHAGRLFHTSDSNRNFVISSSELKAAQKAWSAGTLSDDDLLEATRLAAGAAYLWNDAARNWKTLSKDKR